MAPAVQPSRAVARRRWPCAIFWALVGGLLTAPGRLCSATPPAAARLQRRVATLCIAPVAAGCFAGGAARAEADGNKIVDESRRKAKEDAKKASVWNWNSYKVPTQNYNFTKLRTYLPTVFLSKRQFQAVLVQLENPNLNTTDPVTYELLREQNRLEPTKLLRKECFRTRLWLRQRSGNLDTASTEYERVKRALDEEDTQLLLLSREDTINSAGIRITKRNVQAVIDAIDDLLDLLPEEEKAYGKKVSDSKTIPVIKLPQAGVPFSRKNRTRAALVEEEGG